MKATTTIKMNLNEVKLMVAKHFKVKWKDISYIEEIDVGDQRESEFGGLVIEIKCD